MKLSKDLKEFIELLNSRKVKYIIMGGHAVAYHGYPRFTGDIDFFVERSHPNAVSLEQVLKDFGFSSLEIKTEDFLKSETIVQLGRPPNRIDILTSVDGVEFSEAWNTKVNAVVDKTPVYVISKELLIRNKRAVRRPQDLADLSQITEDG